MPNYQTPGVYIEEITTLPASVVQVETAVPAFIGFTDKHDDNVPLADPGATTPANSPTRAQKISSFSEFLEYFGTSQPQDFTITVHDDVDGAAGWALQKRSVTVAIGSFTKYPLYYQLQMYFDNGGGPCFVVSAGEFPGGAVTSATKKTRLIAALNELEKEDEPTLIVIPDAVYLSSTHHGEVIDAALNHCGKMGDRFTISDVPSSTVAGVGTDFRDKTGVSNLKYGAAYFPSLESNIGYYFDETSLDITHTATNVGTSGGSPTSAEKYMQGEMLGKLDSGKVVPNLSKFTNAEGTFREDGLYNQIKSEIAKYKPTLYPCGSIAGVYCTVDKNRGVWKAPANISLKSVIGPSLIVTHEDQAGLNIDSGSGKSINAIRAFTGRGTLVYGARTLMGNDNEWRYVPVRRLFIMAEESIKNATEFVVFEPNDANTWQRVRTMIENFLTGLWRDGALAGATPKEAFFVNCGLGTSMTQQDLLDGNLIVEIGMAAVRPAEFIILRFYHKLQES